MYIYVYVYRYIYTVNDWNDQKRMGWWGLTFWCYSKHCFCSCCLQCSYFSRCRRPNMTKTSPTSPTSRMESCKQTFRQKPLPLNRRKFLCLPWLFNYVPLFQQLGRIKDYKRSSKQPSMPSRSEEVPQMQGPSQNAQSTTPWKSEMRFLMVWKISWSWELQDQLDTDDSDDRLN